MKPLNDEIVSPVGIFVNGRRRKDGWVYNGTEKQI